MNATRMLVAVRRQMSAGWSLLLISLLVAGSASSGIALLHKNANERTSDQLLLTDVRSTARETQAIEWQARAEGRLSPDLARRWRQIDRSADAAVDRLGRTNTSAISTHVLASYARYDETLHELYRLLMKGDIAAAAEIDEAELDPRYDRFSEEVDEALVTYAAAAASARLRADVGIAALLFLAAGVVGLLGWRAHWVRVRASGRLAHRAWHDELTTLPNRAMLDDHLQREISRAGRSGKSVFLLYVDLDDFKVINDSMGHATGDKLLVSIGERIRECLRLGDVPARLGGDEFAVVLADVSCMADAVVVADRIGARLRLPLRLQGRDVAVSASVGIAESVAGSLSAEDLLQAADIAMYEAKRLGKGQHQVFTENLPGWHWNRLQLETELRAALEQGQYELHYQPIIDLHDGRVTAVEALVRWNHPTRGLLPPSEFIPLTELTGLIVPLGDWVLNEACRQLASWDDTDFSVPAFGITVNLSARQLAVPELAEHVRQALLRSGLAPQRLTLEITESLMIHDVTAATVNLKQLHELGVELALDDFGTGFAAMESLRNYPLDVLKIDRSYIDGLGTSAQDTAIVHGVIAFARMLELTVVAEGIETARQYEQLRALGCDRGQGFYFARPLTQDAVISFVTSASDAAERARRRLPDPL